MLPRPLQPAVAVAVYRSLLRACKNGRHPEVFGSRAVTALVRVCEAESSDNRNQHMDAIPLDPSSVRSSIRHMFELQALNYALNHSKSIDIPPPFDVLRDANNRSAILLPTTDDLPSQQRLPIFDYDHAALLPGEATTFRFFEPRYKRLVEAAVGKGGGGWFLLRMRLPYYSVLVRIVEHVTLPNGEYAVNVCAGPRVAVLVEDCEGVESGAPRLAWAMEYEIKGDDLNDDEEDLVSLRQRCLDLLLQATPMANIASISMPPLDPEAFSMWALRFVMGDSDMSTRLKWLVCRSTSRRLMYIIELLESYEAARKTLKVRR